jgi:hypothetical protein
MPNEKTKYTIKESKSTPGNYNVFNEKKDIVFACSGDGDNKKIAEEWVEWNSLYNGAEKGMQAVKQNKLEITSKQEYIYARLSAPIPEKYHQKIMRGDKELTGYPAQICIDRLNEIFGIDGWRTEEEFLKQEICGKSLFVAIRVDLRIEKNIVRSGFGANYGKSVGDAYGAAFTMALKRACRQLGMGRELYSDKKSDEVEYVEEKIDGKEEEPVKLTDDVNYILNRIANTETIEELKKIEKNLTEEKFGAKVLKIIIKSFNTKMKELSK